MFSSGLPSPAVKRPSWLCTVTAPVDLTSQAAGGAAVARHSWKQPGVIFSVCNYSCGMGGFPAACPSRSLSVATF